MAFIPKNDRQRAIANRFADVNAWVFRRSGGRLGGKYKGLPVLVLHHVGRKSGEARTTPLIYLTDGDDLVIAASKAGDPKNPAWFHNLVASPDTTVDLRGKSVKVTAVVAEPADRAALWPRFVAANDDFADYEKASQGREIPLVRLKPR